MSTDLDKLRDELGELVSPSVTPTLETDGQAHVADFYAAEDIPAGTPVSVNKWGRIEVLNLETTFPHCVGITLFKVSNGARGPVVQRGVMTLFGETCVAGQIMYAGCGGNICTWPPEDKKLPVIRLGYTLGSGKFYINISYIK